jgi:hypothetical protein
MAQRATDDDDGTARNHGGRPDIAGLDVEINNFTEDPSQEVDLELIFGDKWQYCFTWGKNDIRFAAFSRMGADKLSGHPELHEHGAPQEVLDYFDGRVLVGQTETLSDSYAILDAYTDEERGIQLFTVDASHPKRSVGATFVCLADGLLGLKDSE